MQLLSAFHATTTKRLTKNKDEYKKNIFIEILLEDSVH